MPTEREKCSRCKVSDSDGWPAKGAGRLCQMCWEAECSDSWWETMGGLIKPKELANAD